MYVCTHVHMQPLLLASLKGHRAVCEALIALGAKVNVVDLDGSTPLGEAAYNGHREVIQASCAQACVRPCARMQDAAKD